MTSRPNKRPPVKGTAGARKAPYRGGLDSTAARGRMRIQRVIAAGVIVIACVVAYWNSFSGVMLLDDESSILGNPAIRTLDPARCLWSPKETTLAGRPLPGLSIAINYAISRDEVWSYHLTNLAIHTLAALVLMGVVRRTLLLPALKPTFGNAATALAATVAVLWAVHPIQTEAVTYIIQRCESMMGLLYLVTLYCAIRLFEGGSGKWAVAGVLACAAGMLSKEVMATAPLIVLLYDRMFVSDSWRKVFSQRKRFYIALASTWIILALLILSGGRAESTGFGAKTPSALQYASSQPGVILHYLRLMFWPHPLVLDYCWKLPERASEIVLPALVIVALLAATVIALIRGNAAGFLGAAFFLVLAPTSSFYPIIDLAFEQRMYLPSAAVVALLVMGAYWIIQKAKGRPSLARLRLQIVVPVVAVLLALVLAVVTIDRNRDYHSPRAMWQTVLAERPDNVRALTAMARVELKDKQLESAEALLVRAVKSNPTVSGVYQTLGGVYTAQRQYQAALACFEKALSLAHDKADDYCNIGYMYALMHMPKQAIAATGEAVRLAPEDPKKRCIYGLSLECGGDVTAAKAQYNEALRLSPGYPMAEKMLANAGNNMQRMPPAASDSKAVVLPATTK